MAYTREDLKAVKRAIIELAEGQRVVTVSTAGRTVQYAATDLDKLQALERRIESQLGGRRRTWRVITRSGF